MTEETPKKKRRPRHALRNDSGIFIWDDDRSMAATMLAEGNTKVATSEALGIPQRTIYYWLEQPEFSKEVDDLTMIYGVASAKERIRILNNLAKEFIKKDGSYDVSGFNLLDVIKEARMQTEGINLNVLSKLAEITDTPVDAEARPVTHKDPGRNNFLPEPEDEEAE